MGAHDPVICVLVVLWITFGRLHREMPTTPAILVTVTMTISMVQCIMAAPQQPRAIAT